MGKYIIKNYLKQYLLFILITAFFRLLFFTFYFDKSSAAGISEVLNAFVYAFWLDNSSVNYLMILPFFLYLFYSLFPIRAFNIINKIYTYFIIILLTIIEISNIAIYNEWGIKLNYKAVTYLNKPDEAFHSAQKSILIIGLISMIAIAFGLSYLSKRILWKKPEVYKRNFLFSGLWFIITPLIIFGSMRGSLEQIPISQSQSYHSKINFINQASVNTSWNVLHSILANKDYMDKNPLLFYDIDEAKSTIKELYDFPKSDTTKLFNIENPNIVFIFLESWSGDFIDELGGDLHITPGFSKLIGDGVLFTEHYASGMLSHQGISAVFSAIPATPVTYIIELPSKYAQLSCFPKDLQKQGYHTSFLFGGQLNYGNIKAYIYFNEFDNITEGKDFDKSVPTGSLGHHDEFMLDKLLDDIDTYPQPFFAGAFTLSTHSPYDMPANNFKKFDDRYNQLLNSFYYSDSCIYDFMEKAKSKSWYDSTLFVFVADHSHPSPFKHPYYSKEVRKIPLLFYGNVIKEEYRGKKINTIMSQTDIAATLLSQLNMPHENFHWSKDVMNPDVRQFAYYGYDNGYGMIDPKGNYAYIMDGEIYQNYKFESAQDSVRIVRNGKSFVEVLFQEYLDY